MKKTRVALAGKTALFRYGVIANFVYPPPGANGLYGKSRRRQSRFLPYQAPIASEETIRGEFSNNYRGVGQ